MSRQLGSQYVLDAPLGRGAMGEVWKGTDTTGNPLAFKILHESMAGDPAVVQRFLQERAILTGLDHPALVRVRDLVAEGTTLAIVMDLVEGGDLRGLLSTYPVLPPSEVCRIGADVASGLAAVHAAGVVHRDIKPENILLDRRTDPPAPRLTDFGIAKIAEQSSTGRSTILVGTPRYIAPEVFDGQPPSPASDLYGLGILLYEMSCGVAPFAGDSTLAVLRQHVDYLPGRPSGVPDPLWDLIAQLLAKDPATRPGPAGRVSNQLTALAHDLSGAPPAPAHTAPPPPIPIAPAVHHQPTELAGTPVGIPPQPARRRWPPPVLAAATAAAVLVAGLLGWAIARGGSSDPGENVPAAAGSPTSGAEPDPTTLPAPPPTSAAPTSPPAGTSPPPTAAPTVNVLPPPPSDPGVPYQSGTDTFTDQYDLDEGEYCCGYDGELSLTATGLAAQNGSQLARWSGDGPPLPSDCHAIPYEQWSLFLPPDAIDAGDVFCVVTNQNRYAYIEVREREITAEGDLRSVTITYLVWSNPEDQ